MYLFRAMKQHNRIRPSAATRQKQRLITLIEVLCCITCCYARACRISSAPHSEIIFIIPKVRAVPMISLSVLRLLARVNCRQNAVWIVVTHANPQLSGPSRLNLIHPLKQQNSKAKRLLAVLFPPREHDRVSESWSFRVRGHPPVRHRKYYI
jgi:hypothetical protein